MSRNTKKLMLTAAVVCGTVLVGAGISACGRQSTETLVAEAKQYQQKGDTKAAVIQLKNAVTKNPEDGEIRMLLGTLYNETGDPVSAEKELRKALSLGIPSDRALPLLAQALLVQGQFKKVLDETAAAAAAKPNAQLSTVRGDAALGMGDAAAAKEAYGQALAAQPNYADALIGMARYHLGRREIEPGIALVEQAVAAHPTNPEVWMFKAGVLRAQNKNEEALQMYDKVLVLKPAHRAVNLEKAYVEITLGKLDAARADLAAARKISPGTLALAYSQALLDNAEGKNKEALESLQKVLKVAPDHMPSILLSAVTELKLGANQQAEQHLKKYLEKNPDNLVARKLLANALLKASRADEALTVLNPLLKGSAEDPELLTLAGQAQMQVGDFKKSADYFERASKLVPKASLLHTALGMSKLGQGDSEGAISELEAGAALDPRSTKAGAALVMAEVRLKHYDKALAAVNAMEKEQPKDPAVHGLKGSVYVLKNDVASARKSFEQALALQPTYFSAVANLAQLDVRENKIDVAQKRLEAFLDKDKNSIPAMNGLSEIAVRQGRGKDATAWLERASNANPNDVGAAIRLAAQYLATGEEQKALSLARKFQTANSTNPEMLELLGQAQIVNKDLSGALETFSKLVNVVPKSAPAQYRLASVHMMMKNEAAAVEDLKRALALQPNFVQAQLAMAELATRKGALDQALAIARQIQKQPGQGAVGHALEGDLQMIQKKPELALRSYEQALAIAKSAPLIIKVHGALMASGKDKEAAARLGQWLKEHPDDTLGGIYAAQTSITQKQYKLAIEQLQTVLKRAPNNVAALNNLAWAYQQEKDPRALGTAEQAYKLGGENAQILDTLGWILIEQGNTTRGLPMLQKAVAQAPLATDIRFHLATAYNKSGDKANARKEVDQLLASGANFPQVDEARVLRKQLQ